MAASNHRYPAIEGESEFEAEFEAEEFAGFPDSSAGQFENELEDEAEAAAAEFEFEFEVEAAAELEAEGELEDEFEAEFEDEAEGFVNPVRRVYRDAELMAHLSTRAAMVEGEAEAEAFVGALVPLAARIIPRAAPLIVRNAPTLIKGANRIVRQLRRNPRTRALVRAMPVILQRTAQVLADQSAQSAGYGDEVTAGQVVDTLGDVAAALLAPANRGRAVNAVRVFDRRYRRRAAWQLARAGAYGHDRPSAHRRRNGARTGGYAARRPTNYTRGQRVRRRY